MGVHTRTHTHSGLFVFFLPSASVVQLAKTQCNSCDVSQISFLYRIISSRETEPCGTPHLATEI